MAVPKDTYVLSQIWGCEKVPRSEFIANLGLVKRIIKQRKKRNLDRRMSPLYIYSPAVSDIFYLKTGYGRRRREIIFPKKISHRMLHDVVIIFRSAVKVGRYQEVHVVPVQIVSAIRIDFWHLTSAEAVCHPKTVNLLQCHRPSCRKFHWKNLEIQI